MNRRDFIKAVAGTAALAAIPAPLLIGPPVGTTDRFNAVLYDTNRQIVGQPIWITDPLEPGSITWHAMTDRCIIAGVRIRDGETALADCDFTQRAVLAGDDVTASFLKVEPTRSAAE